jgi:hypothetical protein
MLRGTRQSNARDRHRFGKLAIRSFDGLEESEFILQPNKEKHMSVLTHSTLLRDATCSSPVWARVGAPADDEPGRAHRFRPAAGDSVRRTT